MNLEDFRKNDEFVKHWAKIFHMEHFQQGIWKVLNDSHPLRFTDGGPVTTASSDKRLGTIEGYELCLERMKLATTPDKPVEPMPQASFLPPHIALKDDLETQ